MKRIVFLLVVMILAISLCMTTVVSAATDSGETGYIGSVPGNIYNPTPGSSSSSEYEPAEEEEESYIITAIAKTGGKILHSDDEYHKVTEIDSQSFTVEVMIMDDCAYDIVPKDGYRILKVSVDGVDMGPIDHYEFEEVDRNHRIRAYFEKITASGKPVSNKSDEEFNPNTGAL